MGEENKKKMIKNKAEMQNGKFETDRERIHIRTYSGHDHDMMVTTDFLRRSGWNCGKEVTDNNSFVRAPKDII